MPSPTSNFFLEILNDEGDVQGTLAESEDGALEIYVIPDTKVTALQAAEFLEVYDGSFVIGGGGYVPFVYTQSTPSATWIVTHGLGVPRDPVILLDSAPTIPVWTDVEHGNLNTSTIIFPSPVTGKAYF